MSHDFHQSTHANAARRNSGDSHQNTRDMNGDVGVSKSQPKRNYKLLIDPAIKKGHHKVYRYDGVLRGQPPVIPRDPRPPKTKLWTACVAELPIPRFKVDKNYVGALPETTIRFGCLNDNVNRQFLRELCSKFGKIEECKVYYDIKSKKHLGTGKITFSSSSSARQAVSQLDGSSVMGNIIRVSIDRKKPSSSSLQSNKPHSSKDPREYRRSTTGSAQSVLPTPSPSQYSPSVNSTPPTPLISGMSRQHPVAELKSASFARRSSSIDSEITSLGSPASICSASFNSGTFEPISPPPISQHRSSFSDKSLPPPPPPAPFSNTPKSKGKPPPPPPRKQEIYEDISPTASFDDEKSSPKITEQSRRENKSDTYAQSHYLSLRYPSSSDKPQSKHDKRHSPLSSSPTSRKRESSHYRERRDYRSPTNEDSKFKASSSRDEKHRSERRTSSPYFRDSKRAESPYHRSNSSSHQRDRARSRSPNRRKSLDRVSPPCRQTFSPAIDKLSGKKEKSKTEKTMEKVTTNTVYEAISDSDDEGHKPTNELTVTPGKNMQVEDISPASSPVVKAVNGVGVPSLVQAESLAELTSLNNNQVLTNQDKAMEIDDDDDDAMSLSSISSNEETAFVLNTPVTKIPETVASRNSVPASLYQQAPYTTPVQYVPQRPRMNVPPPVPHIPGPQPGSLQAPTNVNVAVPPPMNVAAPLPNVGAPLQQPQMLPPPRPPPQVNMRVPPPRLPFNKHVPPPFAPPPAQPPNIRPAAQQPLIGSYPQRPASGGFIGSFSRPYQGFYPNDYPSDYVNYPKYNPSRDVPVHKPKVVPYQHRVRNQSTLKTKKDLKSVLHRDLIKRLVEHSGFSALEAWWGNRAKSKETTSSTTSNRPASIRSNYVSPLTPSNASSPSSSSATSSLLSSLFSRTPSTHGTQSHSSMPKIPSFRISRKPHARPEIREQNNKRSRKANEKREEVMNKMQRVEYSDDEEEADDESEADYDESEAGDSDSEVEASLQKAVVKSGSSLYRSIYHSSSEDEKSEASEEEQSEKSDLSEEEEEITTKVRKKKRPEVLESDEEGEDVDEDGVEDEEEGDEEGDEDEEEGDEEEEESSEEDEDSDSQWESSEAEEAVQQVIKETKERLDHYKEKYVKRHAQDEDKIKHDQLVEKYLQTIAHKDSKTAEIQSSEPLSKRHKPSNNRIENKENKQSLDNSRQRLKELDVSHEETNHRKNKDIDISKDKETYRKNSFVEEKEILQGERIYGKNKIIEKTESVVEEFLGYEDDSSTQEEKNFVSSEEQITEEFIEHVDETKGTFIEEEVISEEIIKIEAEENIPEEVFGEHSYASFKQPGETRKGVIQSVKEEPARLSPVIDVVRVTDEKLLEPEPIIEPEPEPKAVFPMRSIEHENSIVWDVLNQGVDNEDLKYFKSAFESLQLLGSSVVNDLHWSAHPETWLPSKQKRTRGEPSVRSHKTGCARSEGYYKIPMSEKAQYLSSVRRQQIMKEEEEEKGMDGLKHKQQSRENRAMQRRLISSFVNDDFGDLVKFNKLKMRKKHLKFSKSGIHDWGLFTCEPIAAEEMVVEYVGEMVRSIIADAREKHYEQTGIGSSYLFRLDAETVIDATKVGNNARFINHSCTPNCYAKIINVGDEKKIVIYSKSEIKLNEEITYDYKFPLEDVKIQCLCGTPQCRGYLN